MFKKKILVCIICLPVFSFFQLLNEPELGAGIDPGMALTPFSSRIGRDLNPQPSDHEPSAPPVDHSFHYTNLANSFCLFAFQQKTFFKKMIK